MKTAFLKTLAIALFVAVSASADEVEFLNGSKVTGTVKSIRKAEKEFDFETKVGSRSFTRTYSFSKIHAVTMKGKRFELTPKLDASQSNQRIERTRQEVLTLIDRVGRTPPDWFEDTQLNVPRGLELTWPERNPDKEWNYRKDPGHYVWDVINPNENRWREGVRLMHHIVADNEGNRQGQRKAMYQLGTLYASLFEDWPRAAFWWQKAGRGSSGGMGRGGFRTGYEVGMAKCYWELGNKEMAAEMLSRRTRFISGAVHLWAQMGELDKAMEMVDRESKRWPGAFIAGGDVLRRDGQYDQALVYYNRAAKAGEDSGKDADKYGSVRQEARERIVAMRAEQSIDLTRIGNGRYTGSSLGYSGQVGIAITVRDHQITNVSVTDHKEKQFYSSLTDIPNQIISKQSIKGIDATASATITAEAIIAASAKALAKETR